MSKKWKLKLNKDNDPMWIPGITEDAVKGEVYDSYLIRFLDDKGNCIPWATHLYHERKDKDPKNIIKIANEFVKLGYRVEVAKEIAHCIGVE